MSTHEITKVAGDVIAVTSVVGSILQLLPPIAAIFAILWYTIVGYEKITGKTFADTALAKFLTRRR